MGLVEVGVRIVLVVREELILVVTETNHIVATPELIEELTTTLHVDVIERRLARDGRSTSIAADLVEEILGTTLTTAHESFGLREQDVSKTEDGHVVRLVTAVGIVIVAEEPLSRAVALRPTCEVVTNVHCTEVAGNSDVLGEYERIAVAVKCLFGGRQQSHRIVQGKRSVDDEPSGDVRLHVLCGNIGQIVL